MVRSPGVHAAFAQAEQVRRQLMKAGILRSDLNVAKTEDGIWFPTTRGDELWTFTAKEVRPRHYSDLLDWDHNALMLAPRAFDALGDIVIVKVPDAVWEKRHELGEALLQFHSGRATFHDRGVKGVFRTRDLQLIAGEGGSETEVTENGIVLSVDPAAAYYSPRLGDERARITGLVKPRETMIDLFGGVAPQGIQLAKAGANVTTIDLNPEAIRLANVNIKRNKVQMSAMCMDARQAPESIEPAERVIMNLPHGAKDFLVEGAALTRLGGTLHHHEILAEAELASRSRDLVDFFASIGRPATISNTRHIRNYSPQESHFVFDLRLE